MESFNFIYLTFPLALGLAAIGCSLGLSNTISSSIKSIEVQPKISGKIQTCMIIGCAFIEALVIYLLISIYLIK